MVAILSLDKFRSCALTTISLYPGRTRDGRILSSLLSCMQFDARLHVSYFAPTFVALFICLVAAHATRSKAMSCIGADFGLWPCKYNSVWSSQAQHHLLSYGTHMILFPKLIILVLASQSGWYFYTPSLQPAPLYFYLSWPVISIFYCFWVFAGSLLHYINHECAIFWTLAQR